MKLLLTSSGIKNQTLEKALLELLGKPFNETKIAFIPTAANYFAEDKTWLIEDMNYFREKGFRMVDIVDLAALTKEQWLSRLEAADLICVGGGSEQYLAQVMRETGCDAELPRLLETRVYMGISAGSMVLGKLISRELAVKLMPEEVLEGNDDGLGFLDISILPHFNSDYFAHLRAPLIQSLAAEFSCPVYALDDNSALKVVDSVVEVVTEGEFLKIEKEL